MCKSTDDPLYGPGREIEKDYYELKGQVRHFFSEDYEQACLHGLFHIDPIESESGLLYGVPSAYIKVVARKTPVV